MAGFAGGSHEFPTPPAFQASQEVGLSQSLSDEPITDLERELKEPFCEAELSHLYGINLAGLLKTVEEENNDAAFRSADRELTVLRDIKSYLEATRR